MTFLPIVARELRVAARRRATYWVRTGAAVAVLVLGAFFFLTMQRDAPKEMAMALFGIMTGSAVLYALLSGVRATADCLSEEKREGTLGLLFLTDLKGYDVAIGKLTANSLNTFYGVLAVVPILAIPLLLGGITPGEYARMALVAVNTMFFSLTIGLGVSAMSRSARKAIGMTFLLLLLFTAAFPAMGAVVAFYAKSASFSPVFLLPSPGYGFGMAFDSNYLRARPLFWESMVVIHGMAWAFLVVACIVAPRTWQDKPAGIQRLRWRERWQTWSYGNSVERAAFRRRLLGANAFFWLAARARLKPASVWAVFGLLACGWTWGIAKYHREWLSEGMYVTTGLVLNLLMKGWFASEAGRQLAEDRKQGSLELLLSTPLAVRDILRGQMLALRRQFLGPLLVTEAAFLVFMLATLADTLAQDERAFWICFWLGAMVMLAADLGALYWVGMWQALTARNPNRATLARVLILPWLGMALVFLAIALSSLTGGHEPTWQFFLGWWFGLGLAADIWFSAWSRNRLLTEFRLAAERRYSPRLGLWKQAAGKSEQTSNGAPSVIPVGK